MTSMNPSRDRRALSPELELALECCRCSYAGGDRPKLGELGSRVDWPSFLRVVRFHRVQALVWHCLGSAGCDVPAETADALTEDAASIAADNLRCIVEARALRAEFDDAGIDLLFVKGLTLGAIAYPNPLLKMGWDVDLLIDAAQLDGAVAALRKRGYRLAIPRRAAALARWHRRRKESVWAREDGVYVELHTRLADNAALIPSITVHSSRCEVEVAPGISLATLAPDELFAYLCVHGASSAWFRLKWITDLAALLHGAGEHEIERLYRRSQELGAGRAPGQALLLADRLYATLNECGLKGRLARDRGVRRLTGMALNQLIRSHEPTEVRLGTARIHLSQLLLLPGVGFKIGEIGRQAGDVLGGVAGRAAAKT
jgi:hypothetical protein